MMNVYMQVVRVIYPTEEDILKYEREMADTDDEMDMDDDPLKLSPDTDPLLLEKEGSFSKPITLDDDDDDDDSDIQIISHKTDNTTPKKSFLMTPNGASNNSNTTPNKKSPEKKRDDYPPYATYKYEVEEELAWDYKTCNVSYFFHEDPIWISEILGDVARLHLFFNVKRV